MTSTWTALAAEITACTRCPALAATRTHAVVGDHPVDGDHPPMVLVGEAPGREEDLAGRPFVGKAGQLLDRVLAEVGLNRSRVGVLNVIKCRPPGNRAPKPDEVTNCRPYLRQQLALLEPQLVVALGLTAVTWFLGRTTLAAARGQLHEVGQLRVLATYHPSAAIRFGPNGAPMAALREDLAYAAKLVS